ncbi:glycoside hydrolase 3 protein [Coemansia sp. RSA 2607]|nr:glycoside hydrolase 3 protein [Coemansia sp. RSA 2607]
MKHLFTFSFFASSVFCASQLYGLNYNPKRQDGSCPNVYQVQDDLKVLAPYTNRLRIYSVHDCNQGEPVLRAIENTDWKVSLGLWVNQDDSVYEADLQELLRLAGVFDFKKQVDAIVVGSESIYRKEQTAEQLAAKVLRVKSELSKIGLQEIPVTSSETWPTYYQPLIDAVDFVNMHGFPFWEGVSVDGANDKMFEHIHDLQAAAKGKRVVVGETGWPSDGDNYGSADTGLANAQRYMQQFVCRANKENIEYFWFGAFDQSWASTNNASNVESHWGIILNDYVSPKFQQPLYSCGDDSNSSLLPNGESGSSSTGSGDYPSNDVYNGESEAVAGYASRRCRHRY